MATIRPSLEDIHRSRTGKVSDKWASYLPVYDHLFGPLRDSPLDLLEIGVQNGGSLETWSSYFPQARKIIGCDIDERCRQLRFDDPRIQVVVGDANSPAAFERITALGPDFDIVIDDGSHKSVDILYSFLLHFPRVKPGGLFVIEDTHALYWNEWGGGILNEFSAYNFFKKLVDVINFQFWDKDLSIPNYLRTFFPIDQTPVFLTEGWIDSIEFRNSMIILRKSRQPGHAKLGERLIRGEQSLVQSLA